MSARMRGNSSTLLLLGVLVIALGAGAMLYFKRGSVRRESNEVAELRHAAKVLDMKAEALAGELANLRVERNVLREKFTDLETRSAETSAALAKAREDLARVRKERDEHLAKRLDTARRLEDALSLIAKLSAE